MSYSINIVGRDKAKMKAAIRDQQCKDEANAPHNGVPKDVADKICAEIDRVRLYEWSGRAYGIKIDANGSFSESGCQHSLNISSYQIVE